MDYANEQAFNDFVITVMIIAFIATGVLIALRTLLYSKAGTCVVSADYEYIPKHHHLEVTSAVDVLTEAVNNGCEVHLVSYLCSGGEARGQRDILLGKYVTASTALVSNAIDMCVIYGHHINVEEVYNL